MTHPRHLAELQGQLYVVLRALDSVEDLYRETLQTLEHHFPSLPVTHPNSPHLTIRGYPTGADLLTVNRVVAEWASGLNSLVLTVERITVFGAPAKVVILQIEKTPELKQAFTSLLDLSAGAGLPYFEMTPNTAEAWTFHVSTLYCKDLSDEAWRAVSEFVAQMETPPATCIVDQLEVVSYSDSGEDARIVPFGGLLRAGAS